MFRRGRLVFETDLPVCLFISGVRSDGTSALLSNASCLQKNTKWICLKISNRFVSADVF